MPLCSTTTPDGSDSISWDLPQLRRLQPLIRGGQLVPRQLMFEKVFGIAHIDCGAKETAAFALSLRQA